MDNYKLFFGIVIVSAFIQPITGECNEKYGPSGIVECFSSPYYNGNYQWGTCITKLYMEQRSGGNYTCRDRTNTYCYYQCMLEQYDLDEGPVYDDCSCQPGDAPQITGAPLPPWCSSPDGTQCSWYRRCLERRFPCTGSKASYAIDYGEKFCNLYTEHYNKFSEIGQNWIDAVRKCLQVALVPLLRPYNHPSCKDIKDTALGSHSGCYVNPYPGAPSFCDLSLKDYFQVLLTIKSAFKTEFWGTIQQGLGTGLSCIKRNPLVLLHMLRFTFGGPLNVLAVILEQSLKEDLSEDVALYIFEPVFLRRKRNINPSNSTVMNVLFFDRKKYDLNFKSVSNISIDGIITKVMDDIETGKFELNVGVPIEEISFCQDIECHKITRTVVPGQEKERTGLAIGAIIGIVAGVIIGVAVLCALGFFFIRKM